MWEAISIRHVVSPHLLWKLKQGLEVQSPPKGRHRYIFKLYRQKGPLKLTGPQSRAKFNSKEFAKKHSLGKPVGKVLFYAAPEYRRDQ